MTSLCIPHRHLIAGLLLLGVACERISDPVCTTYAPPTLTRFALATDTLVVSDTATQGGIWPIWSSPTHPDTLRAEVQFVSDATVFFRLSARTPLGDLLELKVSGRVANGIPDTLLRFPLSGDHGTVVGNRVPEPGTYSVEDLEMTYSRSVCVNTFGIDEDRTSVSFDANDLQMLGMNRGTFVVVHELGAILSRTP